MRPEPAQSRAESHLTIRVSSDKGGQAKEWTLTCHPAGGTHPSPGAACAAIEKAKDPFAPVPRDQMCTQIYGGPQTATIEGVWRGKRVQASYNLENGCEIARWNALAPVLDPGIPQPGHRSESR